MKAKQDEISRANDKAGCLTTLAESRMKIMEAFDKMAVNDGNDRNGNWAKWKEMKEQIENIDALIICISSITK